jgi:hypothetical protein
LALQDAVVTIDLVKPATYIGFGKPLILAEKAGASAIKNYRDLTDVVVDYAITTNAYKKAAAIMAQEHRPREIAIASYDPATIVEGEPKTTAEAADKYFDADWYFLLTADALQAEKIAVADFIDTKDYKKYVTFTATVADGASFKAKNYKHTLDFYHTHADEEADAALVGELGNQQVGSITWKFKSLVGITPIDVNKEQLQAIHDRGAIAYVMKSGMPQTSEGILVNGEFIDVMHGRDWVKFNMELKIQEAFKNVKKIPYNYKGIALLEAQATTVLEQAARFGIVDKDSNDRPRYTITTIPVEEIAIEQQNSRIYQGLFFNYRPENAIHATNITGQILQN